MTPFVIATTQRSGSTFFESCLQSHPNISCYHEFLHEKGINKSSNFYRFWCDKIVENNDYIEAAASDIKRISVFEEYLKEQFFARPERCLGGGVKFGQDFNLFWDSLLTHSFRVIHLIRYNLLKCHISRVLLPMKSVTGRSSHNEKDVDVFKFRLPVDSLLMEIENLFNLIIENEKLLKTKFEDKYLQVGYESFFSGNTEQGEILSSEISERVLNFLEVEPSSHSLRGKFRKTNPSRLKDFITNFDEVSEVLKESTWQFLLLDNKRELLQEWNSLKEERERKKSIYISPSVDEYMKFQEVAERCKKRKSTVLFGAGDHTRKLLPVLIGSKVRVSYIVDSKTTGKLGSYNIFPPEYLKGKELDCVVISSKMFQDEIYEKLINLGVSENKILRIYHQ